MEVIVVVGIIALLAGILVPQIAKYLKDAKVSKARADVNAIASSIGDFYKDTGRWPTADDVNGLNGTSSSNDGVWVLVSEAGNNAGQGKFEWNSWARRDTFRNQLVLNRPGGHTGFDIGYPRKEGAKAGLSLTDVLGWNGPYLKTVPPDPWGNKYYCNILALYKEDDGRYFFDQCWIFSPGPNGKIETPPGSLKSDGRQTGELNSEPEIPAQGGDDIGVMIK